MNLKRGNDGHWRICFTQAELNPERFTITTRTTHTRTVLKGLRKGQQAENKRSVTRVHTVGEESVVSARHLVEKSTGSTSRTVERFIETRIEKTNVPPDFEWDE